MTTPDIVAPTLEPKTKLSGKVLKTTLAGALVDVGQTLPGVIHISQLSTEPVNKVEDVVKEGQTVDVWVRRVKKDRIELTMIQPLALEWKEIEPDMVVKGKVVRLEPYGAFVDIGAERPGMVHVSELAHGYIKTPSEIVKEGDEVEAKVLDVNLKKKQSELSMKALEPEVEEFKPAKKESKKAGKRGPKKTEMEASERELYRRMREFLTRYEFLCLPVNQVPPFPVTQPWVDEIAGVKLATYLDWMKTCYQVTVTSHPAISVPAGFTDDAQPLPVGLQIVGRYRDDFGVLQMAHAFEGEAGVAGRRPPICL